MSYRTEDDLYISELRREIRDMQQATHNAGLGFVRSVDGTLKLVALDRPGNRTDKDDEK